MKTLILKLLMRNGKGLNLKPPTLDTALDLFRDCSEAPDMASVTLTSEEVREPGNISADAHRTAPAA